MSVDRRTRVDGAAGADRPSVDERFDELAAAFSGADDLIGPGIEWLGLRPLTLEVDDVQWTLRPVGGTVEVERGEATEGARWRLSADDLHDLLDDQTTPMGYFSSGRLDQTRGRLGHLLDWWLVLRGAIDRESVHVPGAMVFEDADGRPLDLGRSFGHDDDPADILAFLESAGFVHLAGWYDPDLMAQISADMDRARADVLTRRRPVVVGDGGRRQRAAGADAGVPPALRCGRRAAGGRRPRRRSARSPATATCSTARRARTRSRRCSSRSAWSPASPTCRGTRTAAWAGTPTSAAGSRSGSRSPAAGPAPASCGSGPARTARWCGLRSSSPGSTCPTSRCRPRPAT